MKHIRQLDSLRAIAVMLVLCWHWLPIDSFINTLDNGAIGVDIFFVLSGFLITGILLRERNDIGTIREKVLVFRNFYIRRALRIFPIYYLLIFVILFTYQYAGATFSQPEFLASISYTTNFYFFKTQHWGDLTVHFWSLAVEEQFYLIWPFLILLVNRRFLLPLMLVFIGVGVTAQCLIQSPEFGHIPTFTCFDAFGMGGALAWVLHYQKSWLRSVFTFSAIVSLICLAILIIQIGYGKIDFLPQRTLHAIPAIFIISYILLNQQRRSFTFSFILNNKFLIWMGRISYGIYLYHVPVQWMQYVWKDQWDQLFVSGFFHQYNLYFIFVINFILVLVVSWLSWKFIESPILQLKKKYSTVHKNEKAGYKFFAPG